MGRVPGFDPAQPRNPLQRALRWTAKGKFGGWMALNVANKVDPPLMGATRGLLKVPSGVPTILLTHTGAKSGKKRTANPAVELWARGGGGPYRTREAEGEERERLWKLAMELYPGYDDYRLRADGAGRRIPVVVCEPLDPD
jgi:hypothetical protein